MKKMHCVFLIIAMLLIAPMFTLAQTATAPEAASSVSVEATGKQPVAPEKNMLSEVNTKAVGDVLIVFFVLSVVFEVAMTPIFNWRVFMKHAEGKDSDSHYFRFGGVLELRSRHHQPTSYCSGTES